MVKTKNEIRIRNVDSVLINSLKSIAKKENRTISQQAEYLLKLILQTHKF